MKFTPILLICGVVLMGCQQAREQAAPAAPKEPTAAPVAQGFEPSNAISRGLLAGDMASRQTVRTSLLKGELMHAALGYYRMMGELPSHAAPLLEQGLLMHTTTDSSGQAMPCQAVDSLPTEAAADRMLLAIEGDRLRAWIPALGEGAPARIAEIAMSGQVQTRAVREIGQLPLQDAVLLKEELRQAAAESGGPANAGVNQYIHRSRGAAEQRLRALNWASLGVLNRGAAILGRAPESYGEVLPMLGLAPLGYRLEDGPVKLLEQPLGVQYIATLDRQRVLMYQKPSMPALDYQMLQYVPDALTGEVAMFEVGDTIGPESSGCTEVLGTLLLP